MRRKVKNRNIAPADLRFNSDKVGKFINYCMLDGKKNTARTVVYDALDIVKEKTSTDPLEVFETALKNTAPAMEVRSRRVGGANYQVPREVRTERKQELGMKWIIGAARGRKGVPMKERLAEEIILASKNEGEAVKKRENVHKMAEANKAFAHFAW
jgi:small subunit ribosomal protein S7